MDDNETNRQSRDAIARASTGSAGRSSDSLNYRSGGIYNSGDSSSLGQSRPQMATPVSSRTTSGEYDVNNSAAANINRSRMQINSNRDAQEKYKNTSSIAQNAINNAEKNRFTNTEELDSRIASREMYNRAQGTVQWAEVFGDLWAQTPKDYESPEPADPVEQPDFEEMYDKYSPTKKK